MNRGRTKNAGAPIGRLNADLKKNRKNDLTKNKDEEQRKNISKRGTMNRGRMKNARAPIGRLNARWVIEQSGLQICTKKNARSEEREEEEGK